MVVAEQVRHDHRAIAATKPCDLRLGACAASLVRTFQPS